MNLAVDCTECRHWASTNAHNGHCKRHAPRPTSGPDQIAHWPETFVGDLCGDGEPGPRAAPLTPCGACVFWRKPVNIDGIYPVDRLGARAGWWREAGNCVRHAPGPSSDSGQRGFWRVTHTADSCSEASPIG